jgi:hypothetical protein
LASKFERTVKLRFRGRDGVRSAARENSSASTRRTSGKLYGASQGTSSGNGTEMVGGATKEINLAIVAFCTRGSM